MATRSERVILSLQDEFSGKVMRAATATKALKAAINDLDGQYLGVDRGVQGFNSTLAGNTSALRTNRSELGEVSSALDRQFTGALGRNAAALRRQRGELDSYGGRLRLIAKAVAVFGPGVTPIGGLAAVGLVGMTTQLGAAALATTGAIIGFQGVGDALEALNKAELEPTEANLEKARRALENISPSAQALVGHLRDLRESWGDLKAAAADGLMPGVDEALTHLEKRLPEAERILHNINAETGRLLASGAESLAGPEWNQFFDFLETDAVDTLRDLGQTVGFVARGIAEMTMAFDPLNDDFSGWLLNVSRGFADWADGLAEAQGFQDFVDYIRSTGPQVADTLGAIANAVIQIVQASAPLAGPVLESIEAIANTIAAVADSDLGTPIITFLAALSLMSTGLRATNRLMDMTFGLRGQTTVREWGQTLQKSMPTKQQFGTYFAMMGQLNRLASKETLAARKAVYGFGKDFAKAVAPATASAALFGAVATGMTDKVGLTNTATLALAGSLMGPWGTAVGAGIGLVADMAAGNDNLEESFRRVNAAAKSGDITAWTTAIEGQRGALAGYADDISVAEMGLEGLKNAFSLGLSGNGFIEEFDRRTEQYREDAKALQDYQTAIQAVVAELNPEMNERWKTFGFTIDDLNEVLANAAPAAERFGINMDAALKSGAGSPEWLMLVDAIRKYNAESDTVPGRAAAVGSALAGMHSELDTTAEKATALSQALDALFGPALDQAAAADAWIAGIKDLRKAIDAAGVDIMGRSDEDLAARGAIRSSVVDALNVFKADGAAGVAGDELVANLAKARKEIVETAVAAGASRKQVEAYVDQLQLTPENITTWVLTPGALTAKQQVEALSALYNLTPKEVKTLITQLGMVKSQADIKALAEQYNLTPREIRTLIKANATGAFSVIGAVRGALDDINGRVATATINIQRRGAGLSPLNPFRKADGGTVPGQRHPYGDKTLILAAPGEEIITNAHGEADAFRRDRAAGRIPAYADGGTVGGSATASKGLIHEFGSLSKAIKALTKSVDKATARRDDLIAARDALGQSVRDRFNSPLFGDGGNPFAPGAGDFMSILRGDIGDLKDFDKATSLLGKKGLKGDALAALLEQGSLADVQSLAGMSKAQLAEFQRLFDRRAGLQASVGAAAGNAAYGAQLERIRADLRDAKRELQRANKQREHANKQRSRVAKDTGREVVKGVNGAAAGGRRDRR